MDTGPLERAFTLDGPLHLGQTMTERQGTGAPGPVWRATRTPEGPASVRIQADGTVVVATAWGDGAAWALERVPAWVGADDDRAAAAPVLEGGAPLVRDLWRRHPGLRLGTLSGVVELTLPRIVEQKVPGKSARRSWSGLVRAWGEPAPGPEPLRLAPDPARLAATPYHDFHPFGIERRRAETMIRVCRLAPRIEAAGTPEEALRLLGTVPGIGPWTVGLVALLALGRPDAVVPGDYHLPHDVTFALAGEPRGDDRRMLELLQPYRGQRGRLVRLIWAAGLTAPRRGPRLSLTDITGM